MITKSKPFGRPGTTPTPEIEPSPGTLPRKFPENPPPLSDDGIEAAKKNPAPPNRAGGNDDPPAGRGRSDGDSDDHGE